MPPSRALATVAAGITMSLAVVLVAPAADPAAAQTNSVAADRDGWWNRAKGGNLPLTSPTVPFPVPPNGLAVAASNGEPEKAAAVGIRLDVDPKAFRRLILNLKESAANGSTVGVQVAAIKACAIQADWAPAKDAPWPPPPAATDGCVNGTRSADGVWSFDISPIAVRWLEGGLAQNGVLLVENASSPASFQVSWGDRTTGGVSFGLDVAADEEEAPPEAAPEEPAPTAAGGQQSFASPGPAAVRSTTPSSDFSAQEAFTSPEPVEPATAPAPVLASPARPAPTIPVKPISVGDNIPAAAVILGPLALVLGALAAYSLGPAGNPSALTVRREGGVSRALARRRTK
ncbi:MAG: hypothetical protein KY439_11880 [Actinobacteria bacterium]|nr:hypothetical protein [Actinomycetota bacterium]